MRLPCRTVLSALVFGALLLTSAPLQAQTDKPNLTGNWKLNAAKSHAAMSDLTLTIEQSGAKFHLIRTAKGSDGKETRQEFTCAIGGAECESSGMKLSLWFDGQSLVAMEVEGDAVSKSSMKLADKNSMHVDITHISPQADADSLVLEKL